LYTVTPKSGAAGACVGPDFTLTVTLNTKPVIPAQVVSVCSGNAFVVPLANNPPTTILPAGTEFSWTVIDNPLVNGDLDQTTPTATLTQTLINTTNIPQTVVYTVTPSIGNCAGTPFDLTVTVNPSPIIPDQVSEICSGDAFTISLTNNPPTYIIPNSTTYTWTVTNNPQVTGDVNETSAQASITQTLVNNSNTVQVVNYIVTPTYGNCVGNPFEVVVTVDPRPLIPNQNINFCSGNIFSFNPSNNQPSVIVPLNTTYEWTASNNANVSGQSSSTSPQLSINQTLVNNTNSPQVIVYTITPKSGEQGNCIGEDIIYTITINPAPSFPTMYDTICSGNTFDSIPQNNPPSFIVPAGTTYTWDVPDMPLGLGPNPTSGTGGGVASGGSQAQIFGTLINTAYNPLNVTYSVVPTSPNTTGSACAGAPFNYIVTVNPLASISNNPSNQSVCNNNATLPVDWTSFTAGSTYSWTLLSSGIVTGFLPAGAGPTLGTMTLINTGVAQDSVVYLVSSTANACAGPAKPYTIYVNPDAKASFNPVKDTACWPFQITSDTLVNNSPQTADSAYLWYVDNVFIGSGYIFPGYTISASDTFVDIKLVTISRYGCVNDSITHRFYTYNDPKPSFALTYSNPPCGPLTVTFQNQTMNFTPNPIAPFNYHWDFGNGNTSNDQNPLPQIYPANPTFNDTTYFVTLTVSNQCVSRDTTIEVTVKAPPRARFAPAATNVCSNAVLQFNNTSLGIGNTYQWIFGDGSPIVTSNNLLPVQHVYNTGVDTTFYAVLIATNECGVDFDTVAIRVTPSSIRLNWYIVAPTQYGCSPHTVQVVNVSRGATQFEWNFNDPNSPGIYTSGLNSEVIFHTYTTPGIYTINVRALNACTDTTDLDSVRVIRSPIPNISILNNYSCTNTAVRFDNLTDTATRYLWNFGDPASGVRDTSTLENPSHFYNTEGVYIVTLTATLNDISGVICSSQKTDTVRIVKPIVQINAPTTGCIKDSIIFIPVVNSVLGLAPITDTIWQINGVPYQTNGSGQPNFVHVFTQPGVYNITLIVGTASGCYDTARTLITINTIPSITVSNDQRICLGNSVQLLATSNAGNYQWTPLSGLNCYTCPNPIASPTITTPYVVSTMNNFGCKNSDTVLVTVIQPFEITASPSDTICIGESTVLSVSGAYRYIWSPAATLSCISCPNPTANPTITTNYMVVGFDNYSCFTDTAKMSVVVGGYPNVTLPPDQTLSTGTLFPIPSQSTNGPIRTYSWSPSQDLSCADCPTPVAYIKKDVCYVLNATNIYGCSGEDTMCIKVFCENGQVFIPNTFTPDNDGINDKFLVRGKGIKSIKHFRVFNRWGEIVFERNDFPPNQPSFGWDGKVRGVLSTPDVYVYTAEVVCENDVLFTYKGNVTVIR
jgi:gliding motility-associated-like protein